MKPNTKFIKIFDVNKKFLGFEKIEIRLDKHQINRLLNKKYAWIWEYYEDCDL